MRLTETTQVRQLRNGFIAVYEPGKVATLVNSSEAFPCGDLYHGYPSFTNDADYEGGWYPDSPSDLIQTCTAVRVGLDNGSVCADGHRHFTDAEYFDDEEAVQNVKNGYGLPTNARNMVGFAL